MLPNAISLKDATIAGGESALEEMSRLRDTGNSSVYAGAAHTPDTPNEFHFAVEPSKGVGGVTRYRLKSQARVSSTVAGTHYNTVSVTISKANVPENDVEGIEAHIARVASAMADPSVMDLLLAGHV